ncbi:MAG: copper homeostasis protein CutC [Lactobacillales bacterium]|jgi:copper homeostasis protein|nr:copper homeostasis protein CutC [Lactobacillales bacterium]
MTEKLIKELCTEKLENYNGADRIEFCDRLDVGGLTPKPQSLKNIEIPVFVIIRNRAGDFEFTTEDKKEMLESVRAWNDEADGFVIGSLKNGEIDTDFIKEIQKITNKPLTFHMAFDETNDKLKAIDELANLQIKRILTKGGNSPAPNNIPKLREYNDYAAGRIIIMPGSGVTGACARSLAEKTGLSELHGTKILKGAL